MSYNDVNLELLQKAAEEGDAEAQKNLGKRYYYGDGVEQDYAKAFEWWQKAAEQGHADAQNSLGFMYAVGEGVKQDYAKAKKWWEKAAEQGDARTQYNLGVMYERGNGVEQDYTKAVEFYLKSIEQEYDKAQYNLGVLYYNGYGVEQNYAKALELYLKAAEQGHASAQYNLGCMYERGNGVEQDYAKAMAFYFKAAKQGYASAQYNLGVMYERGNGVEQDCAKAMAFYFKAANQGDAYAQYNLGVMYERGRGVEKDYDKSVKFYLQAAKQGFAAAQNNLGWMYKNGLGVEQDHAKAMELFFLAAEQGEAYAQHNLGDMYADGEGVEQDYAKAMEFYLKAVEQDHAEATYRLGYIYYDGEGVAQDKEKALEYFQKAYDNGYECMYAIDMVKFELSEKQINKKSAQDGGDNLMRVYAEGIIKNKNFSATLPTRVLKDLEKDFADTWQLLDKKTKDSLFTAIFFYVQAYSCGPGIYGNIDFAPTINGICKALEIELGKVLYTGYVKYLIDQNINPNSFPKKRVFLKQVSRYEYTYKKPEDVSKFTLGNLKHIVGLDKEILVEAKVCGSVENRRSAKNKIDETMIDYIRFICKEESFGYLEERAISEYIIYLTQEVGSIADSLRNPASHSEIMKCARAEVCGNYVVKVKKILRHFLEKIDIDKFNELLNKKG